MADAVIEALPSFSSSDGERLCEVKILTETGQKYKLHVDVDTNTVVKTEED